LQHGARVKFVMLKRFLRKLLARRTAALMMTALATAAAPAASDVVTRRASAQAAVVSNVPAQRAADYAAARRRDDFAAMQTYRPGYAFWQHVFVLPDHSIAYGSGIDGRLLAIFPTLSGEIPRSPTSSKVERLRPGRATGANRLRV
jgi:hypothetical protein